MRTVFEWKTLQRAALRGAQRAREPHYLAMLRETIAAIENAEAHDVSLAPSGQSDVIGGAVDRPGAGEILRRQLSPQEVAPIIERDLHERRAAAASYASFGNGDKADALRRQADVLVSLARSSEHQVARSRER